MSECLEFNVTLAGPIPPLSHLMPIEEEITPSFTVLDEADAYWHMNSNYERIRV